MGIMELGIHQIVAPLILVFRIFLTRLIIRVGTGREAPKPLHHAWKSKIIMEVGQLATKYLVSPLI